MIDITSNNDALASEVVRLRADLDAARACLKQANDMLEEATLVKLRMRDYLPLRNRINAALAREETP